MTGSGGDNNNNKQVDNSSLDTEFTGNKPRFISVTSLVDVQVVRTVAFHPLGDLYVVGANSKILRICKFPQLDNLRWRLLVVVVVAVAMLLFLLLLCRRCCFLLLLLCCSCCFFVVVVVVVMSLLGESF